MNWDRLSQAVVVALLIFTLTFFVGLAVVLLVYSMIESSWVTLGVIAFVAVTVILYRSIENE